MKVTITYEPMEEPLRVSTLLREEYGADIVELVLIPEEPFWGEGEPF